MRYFAGLLAVVLACPLFAAEPLVLNVWPDKAPGEIGKAEPESKVPPREGQKQNVIRLTNVSVPTLSVYRPEKSNGAAVVIAPGGGYNILAWDLEGTEVAEWLNTLGVTGIVLKYRVPVKEPRLGPLQDAQRALSLVRSKASEWQLDPKRIGMLGFSAGGNLAARACLQYDKRQYDAIDAVDQVSCRPDFGVLVYSAYLIDADGKLKPDYQPTKETPPIFFAHAYNDGVKPENSIALFLAMKQIGVPAELHVYSSGGHGFGLRKSDQPVSTWPARCGDWMALSGLLEGQAK